jgi:hypothetical protein
MKKSIAIGFVVAGAMNWFLPGFHGMFFEPSAISVGESRIIAALFFNRRRYPLVSAAE